MGVWRMYERGRDEKCCYEGFSVLATIDVIVEVQ
jgi:hypothetical protein